MKNKKRFLKTSLISLGLFIPLISSVSTLVSCNNSNEEHNIKPPTPPVKLDEKEYYLQDLENFLSGPNNSILTIPEGVQYVSTKFDKNETEASPEIIRKFDNVTDVIFPSTLNRLIFVVGHGNNLMSNLENIWWEKKGQYVPNKKPTIRFFNFISKSTKLRNLYVPNTLLDKLYIVDNAIYNDDGTIDSLDLREQYFNCLWTDKTKKEPTMNTIEVSETGADIQNTLVSSNNIRSYIFDRSYHNALICNASLSPITSTKQHPITLGGNILHNYEEPNWVYYAPLSIARSQILNAGDLHVNFIDNCEIRKFDMNKSFVWDDHRPGLDFFARKNIFIDFSNCANMTKEDYEEIWRNGIVGSSATGQRPRWTRAELLDTTDPHMIPPKHLAQECSNEKNVWFIPNQIIINYE